MGTDEWAGKADKIQRFIMDQDCMQVEFQIASTVDASCHRIRDKL